MGVIHTLKCWPEPFNAIKRGEKTFEYRKNDRQFSVGDLLRLREWNPNTEQYTGLFFVVRVSYILHGGQFGVPEDYVVMGLALPAPPGLVVEDLREAARCPKFSCTTCVDKVRAAIEALGGDR